MGVKEEGTEAAAATVVLINYESISADYHVELTFDRPFVVAILQRSSGVPLFMGKAEELDFT
jgi:serine protease inhibitor